MSLLDLRPVMRGMRSESILGKLLVLSLLLMNVEALLRIVFRPRSESPLSDTNPPINLSLSIKVEISSFTLS